jgi:hypothetical protein
MEAMTRNASNAHALAFFARRVATATLPLAAALTLTACGSNGSDEPYKPVPAFSGRKANLPPPPPIPPITLRQGDAYTVAGAIHQLKSRIHEKEVNGKDITIVGYIVDSNIATAPMCAVHKTGKKDPEDCKDVPIPAFVIADSKDVKANDPKAQHIKVLGWASNFANVYDAMMKYRGKKDPPKDLVKDELWSVDVPFPLPAPGAKVRVTGKYGYTFTKASTGLVSDPMNGVLTYTKLEVLEPAPEPAQFAKKI